MNGNKALDITIIETKAEEVGKQALATLDVTTSRIAVIDNESMDFAGKLRKKCAEVIKNIKGEFEEQRKLADQLHKAVTAKINERIAPYVEFDTYLKEQVKGYLRQLEEIRQAEEQRVREELRKKEEERKLNEAIQAELEGNPEEAEAILQEETVIVPPVVKMEMPKVDKRQYRVIPRARVTNKMALIRFIAANPALADLLDVNQSVINNKAKAMGKEINNIPGLSYYEE